MADPLAGAGPFIEGMKIGTAMMTNLLQIRQQQSQQASTERLKQLEEDRLKAQAEMTNAYNASSNATTLLANDNVPTATKIQLFKNSVAPYHQARGIPGLPGNLPEWDESLSKVFKRMAEIDKLKDPVTGAPLPQGMRAQMQNEILSEATNDPAGYFKRTQDLTAAAKKSPEEQQWDLATDEQKAAMVEKKAAPEPLTLQTFDLGSTKISGLPKRDATGKLVVEVATVGGKPLQAPRKESEELKPMTEGAAGKFAMADTSLKRVSSELVPLLFPGGKLRTGLLREAQGFWLGTKMSSEAQVVYSTLEGLKEVLLRFRTGAAAQDKEVERIASSIDPSSVWKNTGAFQANLEAATSELKRIVTLMDPAHRYRNLIDAELAAGRTLQQVVKEMSPGGATTGETEETPEDRLRMLPRGSYRTR